MAELSKEEIRFEYIKILLNFILTTVIGGVITYAYLSHQERLEGQEQRSLEELKLKEQRRSEATKVFEELSRLMDTRLYKWRQVAWAIEDGKPAGDVFKRYEDYRQTLFEWSFNINRNRALVCRYFGADAGRVFEVEIMPGFNDLQAQLSETLRTRESPPPLKIERVDGFNQLADPLNNTIYDFNNRLAELIRSGEIGSKDPGKACDFKSGEISIAP